MAKKGSCDRQLSSPLLSQESRSRGRHLLHRGQVVPEERPPFKEPFSGPPANERGTSGEPRRRGAEEHSLHSFSSSPC